MKKSSQILFLTFLVLLISFKTSFAQFSFFKCKVFNSDNRTIRISKPINGASYFGFSQEYLLDSIGEFQKYLGITKSGILFLSHQYSPYSKVTVRIFIQPGDSIIVLLDPLNLEQPYIIQGTNNLGQMLYNSLFIDKNPKPGWEKTREFSDSLTVKELINKIDSLKHLDVIKFSNLLGMGKIDSVFNSAVLNDIQYFYSTYLSEIIANDYFATTVSTGKRRFKEKLTEGYDSLWIEIFKSYPPNHENALQTNWYASYSWNFMWYNGFYKLQIQNKFNLNTLNENFHEYMINSYKIGLSGRNLELGWASYIYSMTASYRTEIELIDIFNEFKTQFPNSPYIKFIEPGIDRIKEFHNLADNINKHNENRSTKFQEIPIQYLEIPSNTVHIVSDHRQINSLEEAVKPYNGRVIYVDIWATWCPPCIAEFKHNKELKKFLQTNNIEMLYISVDDDKYHKEWQDLIKVYNLTGHHIRANNQLKDDLKLSTRYIGIPWYIIIDKYGKIVEEFALRPGSKEELFEQLHRHIDH